MKKLIPIGLLALASAVSFGQFTIGFESPDYNVGALGGQQGWIGANAQVTNNDAHTGTQSVVNVRPGGSTYMYKGSPNITGDVTLSGWMKIAGGSSNDLTSGFEMWSGGGAARVAGIWMDSDGNVYGGDATGYTYNGGPALTVVSAPTDRWIQFVLNYTTGTTNVTGSVDGQAIAFTIAAAASAVGEFDIYHDWALNSTSAGTAYFDDISLGQAIPEPATMVVLGGAALAAIARRRKA
jgi:hypothetical protein